MRSAQALITLFAALATSVHGHGAMVAVTGANGVTAMGMGVDPSTPRDGTRRNPFQQDSSIIRDEEIASGEAGPCGRTLAGGVNNVASGVEIASSAGLPSMSTTGQVSMTIHQVNGDGAGPYTCAISTDATGTNFVPMTIITNVPGQNSRSRARATAFPLVAQAAPGTACTGGPNGDACIVRCRNDANAGPFGGCAVVTGAQVTPPPAAVAPPVAAAPAPVAPVAPVPASPAPVTAPVTPAPVDAAQPPVAPVAPVGNETAPVAPVAPAPVAPAPVAPAPVAAAPVSPAPVAAAPAFPVPGVADVIPASLKVLAAEAAESDEEKRSLIDSVAKLFAKRDHSRKRMVGSRIIGLERRGQWI